LPIKRAPPARPLIAIATSESLIGTYTHYWHGKTQPCTLPDCPAHAAGIPYRWHGYFGAWDQALNLHFLMEVTAQAAETFVLYTKAQGTLRGCLFEARRLNNKPNGRLLLRTKPADLTKLQLPPEPDLIATLSVLWNISPDQLGPPTQDPERKVQTLHPDGPPDPTNDPPPATDCPDRTTEHVQKILADLKQLSRNAHLDTADNLKPPASAPPKTSNNQPKKKRPVKA